MAAAGKAGIVDKLKSGYRANGKDWKVHLDGYDFMPLLKGDVKKGPREETETQENRNVSTSPRSRTLHL